MRLTDLSALVGILSLATNVAAGPVGYGICQAGCAGLATACYTAAGAVFGTVTAGVSTPAVIVGCNTAFGACSAKCALVLLAPTP